MPWPHAAAHAPLLPHLGLALLCLGPRFATAAGLRIRRHEEPAPLGPRGGVHSDGFSRVACEFDESPAASRIYFADSACGGGLTSCRLTELPMAPRVCFDFCRQYEGAKFFGLVHGRDCYCAGYFHVASSGGQGVCDQPCEGNAKEICGGMEKSSLFEMHMCADSTSEASFALTRAGETTQQATSVVQAAEALVEKLRDFAKGFQPGICSMAPEGQRICALPDIWLSAAAGVAEKTSSATHALDILAAKERSVSAASATAGDNASAASELELGTLALQNAGAKVTGAVAALNVSLQALGGPLAGGPALAGFDGLYKKMGDTAKGWHALCALAPVAGAAFAADPAAGAGPAACARECIGRSSGPDGCVAFNFQQIEGMAACQFLTAEGLRQPKASLLLAVPAFEVSDSVLTAVGAIVDCYASEGFLKGHAKGPLGTEVLKEVTLDSLA